MIWEKKDHYYLESDAGCRISKLFVGEFAEYLAWIPYCDAKSEKKAYYAINERTPRSHYCLGVFPTAEGAKNACESEFEACGRLAT